MSKTVLAPVIDELVFACEEQVRLTSLATKTTVIVEDQSTGAELGRGVATGGSAAVSVPPLTAGDKIVAIAELNGARASSKAVEVQPFPAGLAPVLHIPVYAGGQCISVSNRMPRGARIETLSGAKKLGDSTYFHPHFHQRLKRTLRSSDDVYISSDICKKQTVSPAAKPTQPVGATPYEEQLPPLSLQQPLACQKSVAVSGIIHGATVTVLVNNAVAAEACVPWNAVNLRLSHPLQPGDHVQVYQRMEGIRDSDKSEAKVGEMAAPDAPLIYPAFADQRRVALDGLLPDAAVDLELVRVGTKVVEAHATYEGSAEFDLGTAFEAGDVIRARQSLCDLPSPWSEIGVGRGPGSLPPPGLPKTLIAGVDRVSVSFFQRPGQPREGFHDGAIVQIFADHKPISAPLRVYSGNVEIPEPGGQRVWGQSQLIETLPLAENWSVQAIQMLGGVKSALSPPVVVTKPEALTGPTHIDATPCDGVVRVDGGVPGARTGLYAGKQMIGSGYTSYPPPWPTGQGAASVLVQHRLVWAGAELEAVQVVGQQLGPSLKTKVAGELRVNLQSSMVLGSSQLATVALVNAHSVKCPIRPGRQATYTAKVLDSTPGVALSPGKGVLTAGSAEFSVQIQAKSAGDDLCVFEVDDHGKVEAWVSVTKPAPPPAHSQLSIEWELQSAKCQQQVNGAWLQKAAFLRNKGVQEIEAKVYVTEQWVGAVGPSNSYTKTFSVKGGKREFLDCSLKDIATNPGGGWVIGVKRTFMIMSAKYV